MWRVDKLELRTNSDSAWARLRACAARRRHAAAIEPIRILTDDDGEMSEQGFGLKRVLLLAFAVRGVYGTLLLEVKLSTCEDARIYERVRVSRERLSSVVVTALLSGPRPARPAHASRTSDHMLTTRHWTHARRAQDQEAGVSVRRDTPPSVPLVRAM